MAYPDRGKSNRRAKSARPTPKRRVRQLDGVESIDTNDHEFLRQFVTEHGKIVPARITGASAKQQRGIKRGVRKLRVMGLVQ
ncbi:MAG: 30S ribosomal protein S18 [Kiritimatiellae bacterium]|nr:30S ribosomal protein S18 [Kiritimatiellia bacterium]